LKPEKDAFLLNFNLLKLKHFKKLEHRVIELKRWVMSEIDLLLAFNGANPQK